ncbi:MAG: hypothetical protein M9887_02045 [Chitinophagales bacterium]|nr:hypothetical protein [Chitinophagales bacterium]
MDIGSNEDEDDLKRMDLGLMIQAGVRISDFKVGLFYNQGILNVSPYTEDGFRMRNRAFGLSLAYVIDFKK